MGKIIKYLNSFVMAFGLIMTLLGSAQAQTKTVVHVLGYVFPPFINEDKKTGLTPGLIKLLNQEQDQFTFKLSISSPKRRYFHLSKKQHHMMFFEMPQWGWQDKDIIIHTTREIMHGGEVYITRRMDGRDQSFFDDIKNKKISAYYGYHYGFAGFNSDRTWLEKNFKIGLHHSHARIIQLVERNKVDIGVVTLSYLRGYMVEHPEVDGQLLISRKLDQAYSLPALIHQHAPLTVSQLEGLLNDLKKKGKLQDLFQQHGVLEQLSY